MKRALYFFIIAAFVSSCGSSSENLIAIRLKNGMVNECKLLSVRDSSLVVMNTMGSIDNSFADVEVLRFDSIYKVYRRNKPEVAQYLLGGAIGFCTGALIGSFIAPPPIRLQTVEGVQPESSEIKDLQFALVGGVIGMVSGIVISAFILPNQQLDPFIPSYKNILKLISAYPNGEPGMLKLVH
jgi:hypothetical protein